MRTRTAVLGALLPFLAAVPASAEPPIRHAHSSSLYDGPKVPLEEEMQRLVTATDPSANLATLTEVGADSRTKVLKDAAPGEWGAWVPDANKCCADVGMMWRKSEWSLKTKGNRLLTDKVWTDGQGRSHRTYAAWAKFRHASSGRTVFLSVAHLPSNVQNGDRFNDNAQARAWKGAVDGWHTLWNDFRKEHDPDVGMLVADWNIDFHRKSWRDHVAGVFPSLKFGWANKRPEGKGTHGKRLIDATWATRPTTKARLLKDDDSSDHRPYGEAMKWGDS